MIPENLVLELFHRWENGDTNADLQVWLLENHKIDASINTINKRIKHLRDTQLQAKKDAVAAKASEQALDYISIMERDILKLDKKTNKLLESNDPDDLMLAKSLMEIKLKLIDKQMNIFGMDKPEKVEDNQDSILDGLVSKINQAN
jgi:hypothetical protein